MADDDILELAADFASATHADWLREVADGLSGKPFDELRSETPDGISIEPLYSRADLGAVAQFPRTGAGRRASNAAGSTGGWDIRQQHRLWSTEPALNEMILTDLERGVTSVELVDVDHANLDAILAGVHLDLAPVALAGSGDGTALARRYLDLAAARDITPQLLRADLGSDPIGRLAGTGSADAPIAEALDAVASLAAEVTDTYPGVRSVRVDGLTFADAGAAPATELAAILACGVAYLRTLVDAGLDVQAAFSQMLLRTSLGTDQFGDIAKLRGLRVAWARVCEVSGAVDHRATVQAATSVVSATPVDPWVNMARSTIACFSAAAGGADVITIAPFDAAIGAPTQLGSRVARNTQLALLEESNLHRVIDPGGGSYYLETLTDQLVDTAWHEFQRIEAAGGIVAALESGSLQDRIAEDAQRQIDQVNSRRRVMVGVNRFTNLAESSVAEAVHNSGQAVPGPQGVEPLPTVRLGAGFERLQAQAAPTRSAVFLANLGTPTAHAARSAWAADFFAAGGIGAVSNDGFGTSEALAKAFAADPSEIAVLCSSNDIYREQAAHAAAALVKAGAKRVYMAGDPGEQRATYEAAGVDEFVHVGSDAIAALTRAHHALGIGAGRVER